MDAEDESSVNSADKDGRNTNQSPVTFPVDKNTPTSEIPSPVPFKGLEDSAMGLCNNETPLAITADILNNKSPSACDTAAPLSAANIQTEDENTGTSSEKVSFLPAETVGNDADSDKIPPVSMYNTQDNYPEKVSFLPAETVENDADSDKIPPVSMYNTQDNYPKSSTGSSFGANGHLKFPPTQPENKCTESKTNTVSISANNEVMDAEDESSVNSADKDGRNTNQSPVTIPVDKNTPISEIPSPVPFKGLEDSAMGLCNKETPLAITADILNNKSPSACDTAAPLSAANIQTEDEKISPPGPEQTGSERNSCDNEKKARAFSSETGAFSNTGISIDNTPDNYPKPSTSSSFGTYRHLKPPQTQPKTQCICTESETSAVGTSVNNEVMATEDETNGNRSDNNGYDIDQPPVNNVVDNHHTSTSEITSSSLCQGSKVPATSVNNNETPLVIATRVQKYNRSTASNTATAVHVTDADIQAKDVSDSRQGTRKTGSEQNSADSLKNDRATKSEDKICGNQVGNEKVERKCPHVIIKNGLSHSTHETATASEVPFNKKETADVHGYDTTTSSEVAEAFMNKTVSSFSASSNKTHDCAVLTVSAHSALGTSEIHEVMGAEVETNGNRVHDAGHDTDHPKDTKPVDSYHVLTPERYFDIPSKDSEGPTKGISNDKSSLKSHVGVEQNKTTNNCHAATAAPSITPAVHAPAVTSTNIQDSDRDMDKVPGSSATHTIKCNANIREDQWPRDSAAGIKGNHEEIETDKTNENENSGDKDGHRTKQPAPTRHSNFGSNISPNHPVDKTTRATGFDVSVMEINEHNNAITPRYTGISCQCKEVKYEKETSGMDETAAPQPFGEKTLPTEDEYNDVRTAKEVSQGANDEQSAKILQSKVHSDDQHSRANMTLQEPSNTFSRALHHVQNTKIPKEDLDIDKDKPKDRVGKSEDKESGKAAKSQIPPNSDDEGVAEDRKIGEIEQSLSSSQGLPLDNASNKRNVFPPIEDSEKDVKIVTKRFGIIGDPDKGNDRSCNVSSPLIHKTDTNKETKTDCVENASGEDPSEITGAEMNGMTANGVLERPASDNVGKTQETNLPNTGLFLKPTQVNTPVSHVGLPSRYTGNSDPDHGSPKSSYGVNTASPRLEDFSEDELQRQIISDTCMKIEYLAAKASSNQKEATETFTGLNSDILLYIHHIHSEGIENILKGGTSVVWQVHATQSTGTIILTARDQATLDAAAEEFIQIYQKCFEYVNIVTIPISKKCCDKIIHFWQAPMHAVNKFMSKYKNTYVHVDWNGIRLMTQGDRCSTMAKEFELTELLNIPSLDWQPIKRNKHPADGDKSGGMPKSPSTSGSLTQQPKFRTKEGIMVSIYKADITTVEVDAIVNAANEYLQHGRGVARAIADAAGTHFESECQETLKRHGGLRTSEVLVTSAGGPDSRLKCKNVFHTVGPRRQQYNDDTICYRKLREAVFNCLMKAHDYGMKSIAIPAISSGIFGVSIQICSNAMFDAVTDFSRQIGPKTTLQHVLFIDFNSDVLGLLMNAFAPGRIESGGTLSKAEINPMNAMTRNDKKSEESTTPESVPCAICFDEPTNPIALSKCNHVFCKECIDNCFKLHKPACPTCGTLYGTLTGNMPEGTMTVSKEWAPLPGHGGFGTIVITYSFSGGIQQDDHPNPGRHYRGTTRVAYLPDSPEGRKVLNLLQKAFDKRLTFTIGRSTTTGLEDQITWNDIHHKTNKHGGSTGFGYPDPDYLRRVQEELRAKGIE
ncbi:uncharacterized protein LOC106167412 isoform X1 [Lingula anatina]|uniref:RING-type E3 ubiquitin transferase n=1 Tax=Lingula anatina TaxID=7574 RepID=A0A1S3IUP6_LINAN|nr:uncharacterized protein LOC106167412 isoform X1 [Lingula anatina]|eukprot:XP_013401656.1 uncharacterized protein LOC106167412 isoform X1 [Lingula anatina]